MRAAGAAVERAEGPSPGLARTLYFQPQEVRPSPRSEPPAPPMRVMPEGHFAPGSISARAVPFRRGMATMPAGVALRNPRRVSGAAHRPATLPARAASQGSPRSPYKEHAGPERKGGRARSRIAAAPDPVRKRKCPRRFPPPQSRWKGMIFSLANAGSGAVDSRSGAQVKLAGSAGVREAMRPSESTSIQPFARRL